MEKLRVLLADSSSTVTENTARFIARRGDMEAVALISDGAEVCAAVAAHLPDVIVMDLILPRCDGFMVLEQLARLPAESRPQVIILTSLARDDMIIRAMQLGAAYFMAKPFDMQLLCERIREVRETIRAAAPESAPLPDPAASADEQITNLFLTLGIPANIKGYQYLREAVLMALRDNSITGHITKELYPAVARRFDTTSSKVERAMRHAIEVAWNRGRLEQANRLLGNRLFERQDKPANGEFISCVAEKIALARPA